MMNTSAFHLALLLVILTIRSYSCTFLLSDDPDTQSYLYYSPIGIRYNFSEAKTVCQSVGGVITSIKTEAETDNVSNITLRNMAWVGVRVLDVPHIAPPQFRYAWLDSSSIDANLWKNSPPFQHHADSSACVTLMFDKRTRSLEEKECHEKSEVVCKISLTNTTVLSLSELIPNLERNTLFEPLPHIMHKLVNLLVKSNQVNTPVAPMLSDQNPKPVANVKGQLALEEQRNKVRMMNQLIEANNLRTSNALTLGYTALGLAFAVVVLLILVVAGTMVKKPDIRLITMPSMRKSTARPSTRDEPSTPKTPTNDLKMKEMMPEIVPVSENGEEV